MSVSRIIDPLQQRAFGQVPASVADIGRLRLDRTDLLFKIRAVGSAFRTEAAFISRQVDTSLPTEPLCLTGNTGPAGIIRIAGAAALLIIRVLFDLFRNGSPIAAQFFSDLTKGSVLLKPSGNDEAVFIR